MYAAQGMRSKWYGMMGMDFMEESDDDQDSLKVSNFQGHSIGFE